MSKIRALARKIPFLSKIKNSIKDKYIKAYGDKNPEKLTKRTYKKIFGRELNLDNPQSLNEKLN